MDIIKRGSIGSAVEDVQTKLARIGFMPDSEIDGIFGEVTASAVREFGRASGLPEQDFVDAHLWAALVDATFELGDRTLYLRMPYFHGNDVAELQQALGALGFPCGGEDGIFGAHTEDALRKFQVNMMLPDDGIAGGYTFDALRRLEHSWVGKEVLQETQHMGFARAWDVLQEHAICLYGTDDFTRSVASRISNIALATNPTSRIVSADALSATPDASMLLVQIALNKDAEGAEGAANSANSANAQCGLCSEDSSPVVIYSEDLSFAKNLARAIVKAQNNSSSRMMIVLPDSAWMDAGFERSAQHFAITLLDALCMAL
jgi:hypothetical protein